MRRIHFEDKGQDFLTWDIDDNGVVTDSKPFQRDVWSGCKVDKFTLKEGRRLEYLHPRLGLGGIKYRVTKIEQLGAEVVK